MATIPTDPAMVMNSETTDRLFLNNDFSPPFFGVLEPVTDSEDEQSFRAVIDNHNSVRLRKGKEKTKVKRGDEGNTMQLIAVIISRRRRRL